MAGLFQPLRQGRRSTKILNYLDKIVPWEAGPLLATPLPKMFPRGRLWSVFRQI